MKRWISKIGMGVSSIAVGASLSVAGFTTCTGRLTAAEITGSHGSALTLDDQKAAEKSFSDQYGKDEKAALSSRDSADNIVLAKTLYADSQKPGIKAAVAEALRTHAAQLLFRSNDKAAYDLATDLEKAALETDKADRLTSADALANLLGQGVKDVPPADRAPLYAKCVAAFQVLASEQIKAHLADDAVKSLNQVANFANAANDKNANKDASALLAVLRPMSSNSLALMKALDGLEKTPDDKKLNTDVALYLLRDWGDVAGASAAAAKGDAQQLKGFAEMAKYEASGRSVSGMDHTAIKNLAESYETWSKDGKDSKLGHLVLSQRAAELYTALAGVTQGGEAALATKSAEKMTTEAGKYDKEAGQLLTVISTGITASPSSGSVDAGGGNKGPQKSAAEVQKIIDTVGPTDPDWMAGTQLNFPSTLDLTWQPPAARAWDASKVLSQYLWSNINENPGQWKNGTKLMYKVMDVNKNDPSKMTQTYQNLGRMYFNYFKDYARAAYYWQKSGTEGHLDQAHCMDNVGLAHCYFELGNADMAKKILAGYPTDNTVHGAIINAWSVFGDVDQALKMADTMIKNGQQFIGFSAAGDVCRRSGRYDEAMKYYEQFLGLKQVSGGVVKQRAQESYDTIKFFNLFDLAKVPDGVFKDSALGYRGQVDSVVTVRGHKIVDIKVTHREDQCYSSITDVPARIMEKQSVKGIDGCSGATVTSNAIIMGTAKALGNAAK